MDGQGGLRALQACVVFVLVMLLLPSVSHGSRSFCLNATVPKTCISPPTVDSIDISAYLGLWFQIGATGRARLQREGVACVTANYSLIAPPTSKKGVQVGVLNRGLQLIGSVASVGISAHVGFALPDACNAARALCEEINPVSNIFKVLYQIKDISKSLDASNAKLLDSASANIEKLVHKIQTDIDMLETTLQAIQETAVGLFQRAPNAYVDSQKLLNKSWLDFEMVKHDISSIENPRAQIASVARSLLAKSPSEHASHLSTLAVQILREKSKFEHTSSQINANIGQLIHAYYSMISVDRSNPFTKISIEGLAVQNKASHGKLDVRFTVNNIPMPFTAPYWILAVSGKAQNGYEAALVYSCSKGPMGDLNKSIFILSRKPTLAKSVVDSFLALAKKYGFDFECEDSFTYTLQEGSFCEAYRKIV